MKKINTDSKLYKNFRKALYWSSYIGGCAAVDSVLVPFIYAVCDKKIRFLRPFALLGALGLSIQAGISAQETIDICADAIVEVHNDKVLKKEIENEVKEEGLRNYVADAPIGSDRPEASLKEIDAFFRRNQLATFETLDEAKKAHSLLMKIAIDDGFASVRDLLRIRGLDPAGYEYEIATWSWGWTKDELEKAEIEQISDDAWILDIFNYHLITSFYITMADATFIPMANKEVQTEKNCKEIKNPNNKED